MKKIIFAFIAFFGIINPNFSQQEVYNLTVSIDGIKTNEGKVFVAIYDSEESFLKDSEITRSAKVSVVDNVAKITFKDLAKGTYAVSVFHDENNNNKLDTKLFGIPKEPYGFSNDTSGFMGPPKFSNAKFDISKNTSISITVK